MDPIEPSDQHILSATIGWLELGNSAEARKEWRGLGASAVHHPDALEVRWLLCAAERQWEEGLAAARELVVRAPDRPSGWLHQAYALRRVPGGGVEQARDALLPSCDKFPEEATIPYNLACYACLLGNLDEGRQWLKRAMAVDNTDRIKRMAAADPDLELLWPELSTM